MTKKPETLDCVAVKRRAQRVLAQALAGESPAEQAETLHRLAAQAPALEKTHESPRRAPRKPRGKRRSTG